MQWLSTYPSQWKMKLKPGTIWKFLELTATKLMETRAKWSVSNITVKIGCIQFTYSCTENQEFGDYAPWESSSMLNHMIKLKMIRLEINHESSIRKKWWKLKFSSEDP